jgi:hypothetical protein
MRAHTQWACVITVTQHVIGAHSSGRVKSFVTMRVRVRCARSLMLTRQILLALQPLDISMSKRQVTFHGAPTQTEGLHSMGCGLVPQGNRYETTISTPSTMQPSAGYLPPWLGWTRTPLASVCRSNPQQSIPSTTLTAFHVTQGTVEYKSTIPRVTDEGLDFWEATWGMVCLTFGDWTVCSETSLTNERSALRNNSEEQRISTTCML